MEDVPGGGGGGAAAGGGAVVGTSANLYLAVSNLGNTVREAFWRLNI